MDTSIPVLVVDDSSSTRRTIRSLLRQIGFEDVDEAGDGITALDRLRGRPYGLIICDWVIQPMPGLELLKAVRSDESLRRLPFVMIIGDGKRDSIVAARTADVSNYLVNPINAETLKSKLSAVL